MKITILLISTLITFQLFSQVSTSYVNEVWELQSSTLGINDRISSAIDSDGNFVFITNNLVGNNSDIVLSCVHPSGTIAWQQTCTSSSADNDYGVDIRIDGSNNVYVAGAYHNGSDYDYFVAKYLQNGVLVWEQFYDNGGQDIIESLEIDGFGNVYVTGSSQDGLIPDATTIKFDSNGNQQWIKNHNVSNKPEIGVDISIDNNGNIIVGGNVAWNQNESKFLLIKYDPNGNELNDQLINTPGIGLDELQMIDLDNQGNIYVVGKGVLSGQSTGKIAKLNSNFVLQWEHYIDHYNNGLANELNAIQTDDIGNVSVTGYSTNDFGGTDIIIYQFDQTNGNINWYKERKSTVESYSSKGKDLKVDLEGSVFITGFLFSNNGTSFVTSQYSVNGSLMWSKQFQGGSSVNSDASNLVINQNEVFATGKVENNGADVVTTVKYDVMTTEKEPIPNTEGQGKRVRNEILVRFNPAYIIPQNVDDTKTTHGLLGDFIEVAVLNEIGAVLGYDLTKARCFKVHPKLTTNDNTSIARGGSTVELLPYYATFGILIPNEESDITAHKVFMKFNNYVQSVVFNDIYYFFAGANDPLYVNGSHAALVSSSQYPNASINIEPAWDITAGTDSVICGVFDTGIRNFHTDISDGTFAGSSITDGWDYNNGVPITSVTNPDGVGHGTGVSGIIGAWRNNSFGSVGVAGGTGTGDGVSIHDMKIFEGNDTTCFPSSFFATAGVVQQAIVDGAIYSPGTGTGLSQHIQNHSWGGGKNFQIEDACRTAHENEVMLVVSSGNAENGIIGDCQWHAYPADYKDDWITQVGASDTVGIRAGFSNCGTNEPIDFVAPGVVQLYEPLDHLTDGFDDFTSWGPSNSCEDVMNGTSFSSPHVSGTGALMIGYYMTNSSLAFNHLAPEDCEQLIKYYSDDIDTLSMGPGVDQETGHGLINAGNAVQGIKLPDYEVIHFEFTDLTYDTVYFMEASFEHDSLYGILPGVNGPLASGLNVDKYEYVATNVHSLPNGYDLITGWKRDAMSTGFGNYSVPFGQPVTQNVHHFPNEIDVELISFDASTATMRGYVYEVFAFDLDSGAFISVGWYPHDTTTALTFAYSLYTHTEHASIEEVEETKFNVFPNPSNGQWTIEFPQDVDEVYSMSVVDLAGNLVYLEKSINFNGGIYSFAIDNLAEGTYILQLVGKNERYTKKLIVLK